MASNLRNERSTIPSVCLHCGGDFFPWKYSKSRSEFCSTKCAGANRRVGAAERFWRYVDKDGPVPAHAPQLGPCWIWTGCLKDGYGQFPHGNGSKAHRFACELAGKALPENLEPDHLCRVRACVRPEHLEPVTHRVNTLRGSSPAANNARKTHCVHGHEFTPENMKIEHYGGRSHRKCRACSSIREKSRDRMMA